MWPLLLLACHPETVVVDDPAPYVVDIDDVESAPIDLEAIQADLGDALLTISHFSAEPLLASYGSAMSGQSDECPTMYTADYGSYWFAECTSESGTSFSGYSFADSYDDYLSDDGWSTDYAAMYAAATIEDGDGHLFVASGELYRETAVREQERYDYTSIRGFFAWDGPEASNTWLDTGLSPDLVVSRYQNDEYDQQQIVADGGFSPLNDVITAVSFGEFGVAEWMDCSEEPSGTISVRTADGQWVDILFDNTAEGIAANGSCDGCGTAYHLGVPIGSICVDVNDALQWNLP